MKKIEFKRSNVKSTRGLSSTAKVVAMGIALTVGAAGLQSCDPEDITPPTPVSDTTDSDPTNSVADSFD